MTSLGKSRQTLELCQIPVACKKREPERRHQTKSEIWKTMWTIWMLFTPTCRRRLAVAFYLSCVSFRVILLSTGCSWPQHATSSCCKLRWSSMFLIGVSPHLLSPCSLRSPFTHMYIYSILVERLECFSSGRCSAESREQLGGNNLSEV